MDENQLNNNEVSQAPETESQNTTPAPERAPQPDQPEQLAGPAQPPVVSSSNLAGKRSKPWLLVVLVALLLAAVAGWAGWTYLKSGDKSTDEKSVAVLADIPLVRIGSTDGPIGVDYLFPNPTPASAASAIDAQVFEGLVGYSDRHIVPVIASSWTNPDDSTWVFTIKKDIKFQNGKTLTPEDVKKSLDAVVKDENWGFYIQTVASVEVTGANQVTVKTSSPDALLLNRLVYGYIYSKNADGTVSGTGPYMVDVSNSKAEDKTHLVAFDEYHRGHPKIRSIEYQIYGGDDKLNEALLNGQIDIADSVSDPAVKQQLAQKGFASTDYTNSGSYGILLNAKRADSPLAKKEVRQAVAYAIDRADYKKKSDRTKQPTNYIIPKTVVGYDADAALPDVDLAKSKELQTTAGYPNGAPLSFLYISGIQTDVPIIIDELKAAGFQVTGVPMASPREFVAAAQTGKYDMLAGSYTSDLGDGLDIFAGLLGSQSSQFPFYSNPDFDDMLHKAGAAFEPADHVAKVKEINRFIASEYLFIPFASFSNTIYYHNTYSYNLDSVVGYYGANLWAVGNRQ